ncbi:acyl-CoA synthetase [Nocardia nova]|uniref:Acyl-CoA synthetase n=1 Tax=Nocardia nova TaxID=37330 RepID=A0A2S6AQ84_9NOCA|nr:AMP-binding protein [Nocardia nova]MBV7707006.1 AMP-binding protein [Nocardia nova]PPJ26559.1 acyl-CoA synthetase [Nocardia nova]PPJ37359.1 acyl-CoA synthetase [Nocardia nova]
MYPAHFAASTPDKPAVIDTATGAVQTYGELVAGANRLARLLREAGLRPGDHYVVLAENHLRYFELVWAGLNSGLYVTPVNSHLTAAEVAYLINDSTAKVVITTAALASVAEQIVDLTPDVVRRFMLDGTSTSYESLDDAAARYSGGPDDQEVRGTFMLYSSGTTGRPKGIRYPLPDHPAADGDAELLPSGRALFGLDADTMFLSPAPLYHAAPLRVSCLVHCSGGTVAIMPKFDAEAALRAIDEYSVTSSQWVPTMFVRMLKLAPRIRSRFDLSSMRVAVHAAAPCPIEVKKQMIDWWGPIITEYYSGTENFGTTALSSEQWLDHPGSVGRPVGCTVHICDDNGDELSYDDIGTVYFETAGANFSYHRDPERTAAVSHPEHPDWHTLGDIGQLDADGYLYLTDRRDFTIIAGGVNIYPREIEDVLILHPQVADVAAFGVPDPELGEQVKAVVQPADWADAGPELTQRLLDHCRGRLASYKWPRSIDFARELPRQDNGKLYKKLLRDPYWAQARL